MRLIRQEGIRDCGVCCLYNIIRYHGGYLNVETIRKMTNTNENGTSIYNIVRTMNNIGFKSRAYKCNINDLHNLNFPAIAFIKLNSYNHFVIIKKLEPDRIVIFDPIRGEKKYNYDEFINEWQNIIITFEKRGEIVKENNYFQNYLVNLINDNKKNIIILIILSILCSIFGFVYSLLSKKVFDYDIKSNTFIFFLILIIIKVIIDYLKINSTITLNNSINTSLSSKIYQKLFSLPVNYHHSRPVGDITSRINDIYSVEEFINYITLYGLLDALYLILILFIILFIKIKYFLLIIFMSILYLVIYYIFRNENHILYNEVKEKNSNNYSSLVENVLGIDSIKNLNIENKIIKKLNLEKFDYLNIYKKFISVISHQSLLLNFIESSTIFLVLFIGNSYLNNNLLSIGELSMVYTLVLLFFNSLRNIISLDELFIKSKISYKRIHNLLNVKENEEEKHIIKDIDSIKFKDVSFSFSDKKILSKISLTVDKGDFMLVNGRSGTGKSTLFKLLNKEMNIKEGNIFINDKDINDIKDSSIKNNISYVSQNEYIFNDSIKNNILMYKSASNKEIDKVLKATTLDKVLKNRNISLDYQLEDNGHNLSGGERQRIILARTLLRNTNFIIFDETTNELDVETERFILDKIKNDYKKTIVLISHRESNVDMFNKRVII